MAAAKFSRNNFISEKRRTVNHWSYISFKRAHLCNYSLLPATVVVLETFLEAISWKPFQLFRRNLNYVSSITNVPSLQYWFHWREQVKISCSQVRGCYIVVTLFFANKTLTKTDRCAGALSCRRNQLFVLHISGHFLLTTFLIRRRMSMYIFYSRF
jgi:hypothetical protein